MAPYLPTFHRKKYRTANSDDNIDNHDNQNSDDNIDDPDNHEDSVDLSADVVSVAWNSPQGLPQNLLRSDQRCFESCLMK